MKPEDKQLLLQDLCARLPYGVKCQFEDIIRVTDGESSPFYDYVLSGHHLGFFIEHNNFYIKPYLRPMSSMTEEELEEYSSLWNLQDEYSTDIDIQYKIDLFEWLNKKMFDYRGLIPKGLAIEVTKDNNPYKD